MTPLRYSRRILSFFGFCSMEPENFHIGLFLMRFYIIFSTIGMATIPTSVYLFLHADSTETVVFSMVPIAGFIMVCLSYVTFFTKDHVVDKTMHDLNEVFEKRKCENRNKIRPVFLLLFFLLQNPRQVPLLFMLMLKIKQDS